MDRLPKKFAQPIHPSTATALPLLQFAVNANTCLRNPNPNPKPGFDLSQTRKPGFTDKEGTRVWKLYIPVYFKGSKQVSKYTEQ